MNICPDVHRWHARQSSTSTSGLPSFVTIPLIVLSVFFVASSVVGIVLCMRPQSSMYDDNDCRSRTTLGADEPSRSIVVHRDAGRTLQDVDAAPVELPPPYTSISSG
ncbi:hypothetical protein OG21DRAFT_1514995 [Imleria badia]|nr:hypothetical protein OG21DRAFT_1514995 [Imleria badia]